MNRFARPLFAVGLATSSVRFGRGNSRERSATSARSDPAFRFHRRMRRGRALALAGADRRPGKAAPPPARIC
jgi:hypothetical protein